MSVKEITEIAHAHGVIITVVDGAQGVVHMPIDVQELGVDFYAFGGQNSMVHREWRYLGGKAKLLNSCPRSRGWWDDKY